MTTAPKPSDDQAVELDDEPKHKRDSVADLAERLAAVELAVGLADHRPA